jgi:hypothetical protein
MSFFSNPLAEEDEVVPPDYPLDQYDERKREDDFNELLVRFTKLEAAQHSSGEAGAAASMEQPELVECLKQNRQIRTTLEEMWGDISNYDRGTKRLAVLPPLSSEEETAVAHHHAAPLFAASSELNTTLNAVNAQMHAQAVQWEAAASSVAQRADGAAAHLSNVAHSPAESPTASPFTTLYALSGASAGPHPVSSSRSANPPTVNVAEVEAAVQALESQLPSMSAEEAALVTAAVQHLQYGLRSWTALAQLHTALHRSVAAKTQEQAEAQLAGRTFARWVAARQLAYEEAGEQASGWLHPSPIISSGSALAPAVPPLSLDLALADLLNKELNEGNWRLEAVLATLLADQQSAARTSLAGSALVQHVSLLDYARELETEVERLGSAVLYLRAVLADPSSWDAEAPAAVVAPSSTAAGAATAARGTLWAARLTRLRSLEVSLCNSLSSSSRFPSLQGPEATRSIDSSADEILLQGLAKLVELYDACLQAVALLTTYFEKQSASATFLVRAMRGGGPLDEVTVERVLDVPLPDAASVCDNVREVAVTCAEVASTLQPHAQKAAATSASTLARWEAVRTALAQLLRESVAAWPPQQSEEETRSATAGSGGDNGGEVAQLLMAYASRENTPCPCDVPVANEVRAEPCWDAVLREEEEAFKVEKAEQRAQTKEYWLNQRAEADKKLTWLMKQPNARLLLDLCAAEKEKEELCQQLKLMSGASADASELQHTLDDLQRQVGEATRHNTALREELEGLQARKRDLERERANLIASLS